MSVRAGKWVKGKKTLTGYWWYNWSSDCFTIELNSVDKTTGLQRKFTVYGDHPEFNGWKLVRE